MGSTNTDTILDSDNIVSDTNNNYNIVSDNNNNYNIVSDILNIVVVENIIPVIASKMHCLG